MTKTGNRFIDEHFIIASVPPAKTKSTKTTKVKEKPQIRVNWKRSGHGWTVGEVTYKGKTYRFEMKNFLEPSTFGIENGCISKLFVTKPGFPGADPNHTVYGSVTMNYDRGWDVKPKTADEKAILKALLDRFNNGMSPADEKMYRQYVW